MVIRKDNVRRMYKIYFMDLEDGLYDLVQSVHFSVDNIPSHKDQRLQAIDAAETLSKRKMNRNYVVVEINNPHLPLEFQVSSVIYKDGFWV